MKKLISVALAVSIAGLGLAAVAENTKPQASPAPAVSAEPTAAATPAPAQYATVTGQHVIIRPEDGIGTRRMMTSQTLRRGAVLVVAGEAVTGSDGETYLPVRIPGYNHVGYVPAKYVEAGASGPVTKSIFYDISTDPEVETNYNKKPGKSGKPNKGSEPQPDPDPDPGQQSPTPPFGWV